MLSIGTCSIVSMNTIRGKRLQQAHNWQQGEYGAHVLQYNIKRAANERESTEPDAIQNVIATKDCIIIY